MPKVEYVAGKYGVSPAIKARQATKRILGISPQESNSKVLGILNCITENSDWNKVRQLNEGVFGKKIALEAALDHPDAVKSLFYRIYNAFVIGKL